jgi:hypothetical protein
MLALEVVIAFFRIRIAAGIVIVVVVVHCVARGWFFELVGPTDAQTFTLLVFAGSSVSSVCIDPQ